MRDRNHTTSAAMTLSMRIVSDAPVASSLSCILLAISEATTPMIASGKYARPSLTAKLCGWPGSGTLLTITAPTMKMKASAKRVSAVAMLTPESSVKRTNAYIIIILGIIVNLGDNTQKRENPRAEVATGVAHGDVVLVSAGALLCALGTASPRGWACAPS